MPTAMSPPSARAVLTRALTPIPLFTDKGEVFARDCPVTIRGRGQIPCWLYRHADTGLVLCFGFFPNFTDHDLICKVVAEGQEQSDAGSPALQVNAERCFWATANGALEITHHGSVSPEGRPITRGLLLSTMPRVAKRAVGLLGGLEDNRPGWQIRLGDTGHVAALLDRLFAYCLGVEQVKRHVLKEFPLPVPSKPKTLDEDFEAPEGSLHLKTHRVRERSRRLVERRKKQALADAGVLRCEVCDLVFEERYGSTGEGYIECHHTVPVALLGPNQTTKLSELALVCANCHRMLHRRSSGTSLTVSGLRRIVAEIVAKHPAATSE